jgi:hypothetical protein
MGRNSLLRRARPFALVCLVGLLVAGGAQAANAHRTDLVVEILSEQASLAPDGRSMSFDISTVCDRKWTIVEARVSVTQDQASGEGPFTPSCTRLPQVVRVTVPARGGAFETGQAQASALLVVAQGKKKEARDSASIRVRPSVSVVLADDAVLDGEDVMIDVRVTCPVSSNGLGGQVRIFDGQVGGTGSIPPTPCDRLPHTTSVRVEPSQGSFHVGSADAEAFASIEEGGDVFPGADLRTIQIREA